MAILIEEENKSGVGILGVLTWVLIIGAIAAAVYYVFFAQPQLVAKITAPVNFQNTQQLLKINVSPKDVIESPAFQSLKQYITPLQPSAGGRANPFLST
jgi:hypothetical protein